MSSFQHQMNTSEVTGLSHNSHLITLLVEDEVGLLCSDSILISLSSPPVISIQNPQSNQVFQLGDAIDFIVQATDNEDISTLLNVQVFSDIDGFLWEGTPDPQGFCREFNHRFASGNASTQLCGDRLCWT